MFAPSLTIVLFILMTIIFLISKVEESEQKMSSFESGFDSKMILVNFSNQYYMIAMLFLMFDLEIVLMLPLPISLMKSLILGVGFITLFMFVLLLEWKFGLLDWVK